MYEIGKTFSQMAKFAQDLIPAPYLTPNLCAEEEMAPRTQKGAPIQGALQKTGADLTINGSAKDFLVTKAHVFCPFHSR
jgi:hypothetical protein